MVVLLESIDLSSYHDHLRLSALFQFAVSTDCSIREYLFIYCYITNHLTQAQAH